MAVSKKRQSLNESLRAVARLMLTDPEASEEQRLDALRYLSVYGQNPAEKRNAKRNLKLRLQSYKRKNLAALFGKKKSDDEVRMQLRGRETTFAIVTQGPRVVTCSRIGPNNWTHRGMTLRN